MCRRNKAQSRGRWMRTRAGKKIDRVRRAAMDAAGGFGAAVGPRIGDTVDRVSPVIGKARETVEQGWGSTTAAVQPLLTGARTGTIRTGGARVGGIRIGALRIGGARVGSARIGGVRLDGRRRLGRKSPAGWRPDRAAELAKAAMARSKAKSAKQSRIPGRRVGLLVGLLTAGAATGAASAYLIRRRNRCRWEEYESKGVGVGDESLIASGVVS